MPRGKSASPILRDYVVTFAVEHSPEGLMASSEVKPSPLSNEPSLTIATPTSRESLSASTSSDAPAPSTLTPTVVDWTAHVLTAENYDRIEYHADSSWPSTNVDPINPDLTTPHSEHEHLSMANDASFAPPIQYFPALPYPMSNYYHCNRRLDLIRNNPNPPMDDFSAIAQIIRTARCHTGRKHNWTWSEHYNTLYVAILTSRIDELNTKLKTGLHEQPFLRDIPLDEVPGDLKHLVAFAQMDPQRKIDWMWCEEHVQLLRGVDINNPVMGPEELDTLVKRTGDWMIKNKSPGSYSADEPSEEE